MSFLSSIYFPEALRLYESSSPMEATYVDQWGNLYNLTHTDVHNKIAWSNALLYVQIYAQCSSGSFQLAEISGFV